jgi:GT2 family glycosyltransferase
MKHVSAIIPNYNGRRLLEKHLPAVVASLREGDELIVVDDASTDDSVAWLTRTFFLKETRNDDHFLRLEGSHKSIKIVVVQSHANVRFAAAANIGVQEAMHPYIFLINSDVSPEPTVLTFLLPHFEDTMVFAVGCREIEGNEVGKIGGKNILWFEKGMFMHSRAAEFSTGETAWASGGSALFDKEKWQQLGGFDLDYYPAYWEDTDLSFRARKMGWKVLFEASAVVHHHHESTNSDVFGQQRMSAISWRNANTFVWKNGTVGQKLAHIFWKPYWWIQRQRQTIN